MRFRFRLSKVLEWYERQYEIEAARLQQSIDRVASALRELELHRERREESERQMLRMESLRGDDLRAQELHRARARMEEVRLLQACQTAEKQVETQRVMTLSAQRRLRLVEKLRERKRSEFDYLAARELEEIGADSYLAGFARTLASNANNE